MFCLAPLSVSVKVTTFAAEALLLSTSANVSPLLYVTLLQVCCRV